MVIGICGRSGSGKTAICGELINKGAFVIDADVISRDVVNNVVVEEIKKSFPEVFIDGVLSRRELATVVFKSKDKLEILNSITHPAIKNKIVELIKCNSEYKYIIVDAAVLIEAGMKDLFDCTVCVVADDSLRKSRIVNRDDIDNSEAENRLSSQNSDEFYISNTDFYILNDGNKSLDVLADTILERSCHIVGQRHI